jgi:hypothetical protein
MDFKQSVPKLSLIAQFDDLTRQIDSLVDTSLEDYFVEFLKRVNEWRMNWCYCENQLNEWKEKYSKLELEYITLERTLKNLRECYKRETSLIEKVTKEKELLSSKLNQVKILINDRKMIDLRERQKVISELNLEVVEEEKDESIENVLSDIDYDVSGEEVLKDTSQMVRLKRTSNDESKFPPAKKSRDNLENAEITAIEVNDKQNDEKSKVDVNFYNQADKVGDIKKSESKSSINSFISSRKMLTTRKHNFVQKKSFKAAEKCSVCGTSIGFYSNCFRCSECRACCHNHCKVRLPLPCVPYVAKDKISKGQRRFVTIDDYTLKSSRPCVPALIIHCCSEIERRGLNEPGLYRIPGSDQEVKRLKEKILKSNNGFPLLHNVDVHVICGTVKDFLLHLDDPLLTRVLWRDFVNAAKFTDPEDCKTFIGQAVSELPLANRQTLAYLMIHMQKIASSPACKMPIENLAKIFGPTIVGYSSTETPTIILFSENQKQIKVMETLLQIPVDFWNNIILDPGINTTFSASMMETPSRVSIGPRSQKERVYSDTFSPFTARKVKKVKPLF